MIFGKSELSISEEADITLKEETELLEKGADQNRSEAVTLADTPYPAAAVIDDLWENKTFRVSDSNGPSDPVRLRVEAHGSVHLMMDFFRDLRRSPNMRLDRMAGTEVWLRLNDRLRLEEYLEDMDSVAWVRLHDSNLEVKLAYPPERFIPDGSDGSGIIEAGALVRTFTSASEVSR